MPEASRSESNVIVEKRRFDARDFQYIAEYIVEEFERRKKCRKDLEGHWKEIDRQLAMQPKTDYKINPFTGRVKPGMGWMPERELPLQAQTLEILCADARRMLFPDTGPFFRAHALVTDEYLEKVDFQSLISGDSNDTPSFIYQDNVDRIVEGVMGYIHEQGNFYGQWDKFNAEAFAYGTGVGRVRKVKKPIYIETAKGMTRDDVLLPIFFPVTIKNTYLDDTPQLVMNEGHVLGPATIFNKRQKLSDLILAARDGSGDPKDEDGGWMPKTLKNVEADKDGCIEIFKWEGDLVVERKTTDNMFIPGAICTVIRGNGKPVVVRMAFREKPFSSYVTQPYHIERTDSPYGVGPLMKGEPLQAAATEMFCRVLQAAILNTEPPVKYDPEDPWFASTGGPVIEPRALWASAGDVEAVEIGNSVALMQAYSAMVAHYADVTGMHAPRLGQQTVSHTTAYAKEAELSRGQVRTVDYANTVLDSSLSKVLDMQFAYLRDVWPKMRDVWVPDYGGFVKVIKDAIPPDCVFEVFGSAGPAEKRARISDQMAALQQVIQIDVLKQQIGQSSPLDYTILQKTILKGAGFADVDILFASAPTGQAGPAAVGPGVPGASPAAAGTTSTALQALAFGGGGGGGV